MLSQSQFALNFSGLTAPGLLTALLDFDNNVARGSYFAAGFDFMSSEDKFMLRTYSHEPEFLNRLHEFAQADAGGSIYALWQQEDGADLENSPVVIFGSEGGYHIVAANARELLEILANDAEPIAGWDRVSYYRDEAEENSLQHARFISWLKAKTGISSIRPVDEIVSAAQSQFSEAFANWMKRFVPVS